jgi:hypothetical protein
VEARLSTRRHGGKILFKTMFRIHRILMLLGLSDPDPLVMEVWIRIRIFLSSSKNSKKNLASYCFGLLLDFLSLKQNVNEPSKSNKQKNFF